MKKENVNPVVPTEEAQHLVATEVKKNTLHSTMTEPAAEVTATVEYPLAKADDEPVPFVTGRAWSSLADSGYSLETGIGEFLDNSVEADATEIDLLVKHRAKSGRSNATQYVDQLAVVDNGRGMVHETIKSCLVLGASMRTQVGGQMGIGKYGMGLPAAATGLAWRVEVFSRTDPGSDFSHVYLDFNEWRDDDIYLPLPRQVSAQDSAISEYSPLLEGKTGTIIVLKNLKSDYIDGGVAYYIARTYRKFIKQGVLFRYNGSPIYLHDPLYMDGPTRFDVEAEEKGEPQDPKATPWGSGAPLLIPLPIKDKPGETANIEILLTMLPEEWYTDGPNPGSKKRYQDRKIDENEGVSILRAGREVYNGPLSPVIGRNKDSNPKEQIGEQEVTDRWWGFEISFPPELDEYFEMRYTKNEIIPKDMLKQKIRAAVKESIRGLRNKFKTDRAACRAREQLKQEQEDSDPIKAPEEIYQEAVRRLPKNASRGTKNSDTEQKQDATMEAIAKKRLDPIKFADEEKRARKKAELSRLPLVVYPSTSFFSKALFYPEYQLDQIILHLNTKHPFYVDVMDPLIRSWPEEAADTTSDNLNNELLLRRNELKNALFLLLFSLAKGEEQSWTYIDNEEDRAKVEDALSSFRDTWGTVLASAVREVRKKRGE